jgi:hypothetical protein
MNNLNLTKLQFYPENDFSFSSKLVNFDQAYFSDYSYDSKPAFLASFNDGLSKALIVLNTEADSVENIFVEEFKDRKLSNPNFFPEFLYNSYFSNYKSNSDIEMQLVNYEVTPVYKFKEYSIIPFESRIEVIPQNNILDEVGNLDLSDDFEKEIVKQIKSFNSEYSVFELCRILNSYRRVKFNLINKTDSADYFIHHW